jgi:hypothetical protein
MLLIACTSQNKGLRTRLVKLQVEACMQFICVYQKAKSEPKDLTHNFH